MLEFLMTYWWVFLLIAAGAGGAGYLAYLKKKRDEANQRGFVIITAGCITVLIVLFYVFGIIAALFSILGFFLRR